MFDPTVWNLQMEMLLHHLIGVAFLVLLYSVLWLFLRKNDKRTIRKISLCNDIDEANTLRVRSEKRRVIVLFLLPLGLSIIAMTTVLYLYHVLFVSTFVFAFLAYLFFIFICLILFNRRLKSMLGNIQPMSLDEFGSHKRTFCLFLRGFSTDELSHDLEKVESRPKNAFSEVHYVKDVEKQTGVKVYAVGNPKELDSPYGAQRVYLDNATWQEDVLVMMACSHQIHIRVCDTPSCRWELQQAQMYLDKVTLVVDDMRAYISLRNSKALDLDLPPLDDDIGLTLYVLEYHAASGWEVTRKKLTHRGYVPVWNALDKGKPLRDHSIFRMYVGVFMITLCQFCCIPDIVTLARESHEWRESRKRLEWDGEQWASEIGKKCPLLAMEGCTLNRCCVEQDSFVFLIDVSDNIDQDSLCLANLCNALLSTIFFEDDPGKKMFYEKIYLTYHFIKIHLSLQDGSATTFSITEDDMIKMGVFQWHIPSHRSEEEQMEFMWSLWSPPYHA